MDLMNGESVKVEYEDGVAWVTINRPQALNCLNADVLHSLVLSFEALSKNNSLRVVLLTGAGERAFVAGADIKLMSGLGTAALADFIELGQRATRAIECFRTPVISVINGYALGGGLELALSSDLIIAAKSAKLGLPEVGLGMIPGFGGTQRLGLRVGIGAARRLIYTGAQLLASEAFDLGLVDIVTEPELLHEAALGIAKQIRSGSPLAVQAAKRVINAHVDSALISGLQREVESFLSLASTVDREEGMKAFLEKRAPKFIGK